MILLTQIESIPWADLPLPVVCLLVLLFTIYKSFASHEAKDKQMVDTMEKFTIALNNNNKVSEAVEKSVDNNTSVVNSVKETVTGNTHALESLNEKLKNIEFKIEKIDK